MFLVLVAFAVYEEMSAMGPRDPLRPDFGPDGPIVDSMTVAEEAEARGESATARCWTSNAKSRAAADGRRADGLCVRGRCSVVDALNA